MIADIGLQIGLEGEKRVQESIIRYKLSYKEHNIERLYSLKNYCFFLI